MAKTKKTPSSGNVFRDLGFRNREAEKYAKQVDREVRRKRAEAGRRV